MRTVLLAVLCALSPSLAMAETRVYLVPLVLEADARVGMVARVKYLTADPMGRWTKIPLVLGESWACTPSGDDDWCLVEGEFQPATSAVLDAQPDVVAVPANLESNIGGQAKAANTAAESAGLPPNLVNGSTSWGDFVRMVRGGYLFNHGMRRRLGAKVRGGSVAWTTTLKELPAGTRQALADAADDLGIPRDTITVNSTLSDVWATAAEWSRGKKERIGPKVPERQQPDRKQP